LSHLPHSAIVFGEETNSSNPKPPYSPDLTIYKAWFFQGFRTGHPQKKLNRQDSKSHSQQYQKRAADMLPAMARPLNQICMCRRAELSG